jgi:short subunit dehydrogenase-like uncharacterized protein
MTAKREARELDLVLVGASGFVGRLTAAHLAGASGDLHVGLAGRSAARLEQVRDSLGPAAATWPLIVVDAFDSDALRALALRAKVVATTVGPYVRLGMPLAAACALAGTHYADLTGEVLFVRRSADMLHEEAQRSGARIVHACGFDSVPSDLAVLLTATAARDEQAGGLTDATLYVRQMKGGFSGGTIDSGRQQAIEAGQDAWARKVLADPYALSPDRSREPATSRTDGSTGLVDRLTAPLARVARMAPVHRDSTTGHWYGPFVMAAFNTRVVRRSNALSGWGYGRGLRYREVVDYGSKPTSPFIGTGMSLGLAAGLAAMSNDVTRPLVDRFLPAPGEGPSASERAAGRFLVEVVAQTVTGATYRTRVGARLDPGYDGTAVMFGQSALALAEGGALLPQRAGVLTPATGIGIGLADRLRTQGFTVETERVD